MMRNFKMLYIHMRQYTILNTHSHIFFIYPNPKKKKNKNKKFKLKVIYQLLSLDQVIGYFSSVPLTIYRVLIPLHLSDTSSSVPLQTKSIFKYRQIRSQEQTKKKITTNHQTCQQIIPSNHKRSLELHLYHH